jgi:hypothetical protein
MPDLMSSQSGHCAGGSTRPHASTQQSAADLHQAHSMLSLFQGGHDGPARSQKRSRTAARLGVAVAWRKSSQGTPIHASSESPVHPSHLLLPEAASYIWCLRSVNEHFGHVRRRQAKGRQVTSARRHQSNQTLLHPTLSLHPSTASCCWYLHVQRAVMRGELERFDGVASVVRCTRHQ